MSERADPGPIPTRIVIDDVPDLALASNQREGLHYMERAQLVNQEFTRAVWLLKAAFAGADVVRYNVPVTVTFRFRLPAGRSRDADNMVPAFKVWL